MLNVQNPSSFDKILDVFKQGANKVISTANNVSVKYGNGAMTPRIETIADKQASDYQKVVEARRIGAAGGIKDDPRNNPNFVYNGVIRPTATPIPLARPGQVKATPIPLGKGTANRIPLKSPTPTVTLKTTATTYPNQQYVENNILPLTRKYGIPDAIVAGQWAAEGRFINPKNNNFFNLMYNGELHNYQNVPNHIADYALTIKNILKSKGYDMGKMTSLQILKALQEGKTRFEGHNIDPSHYVELVASTPEYKAYQTMQDRIDNLNQQLKKKK